MLRFEIDSEDGILYESHAEKEIIFDAYNFVLHVTMAIKIICCQ